MDTKEENCIVLDFLPDGYPDRRHVEPIAQVIGSKFYTLLEIVSRENVDFKEEQEVYIGEGKRDDTKFIKGQIDYASLTNMAKNHLESVIDKLVDTNEAQIIDMLNKAGPVTPRMHSLDLIPGLGKKFIVSLLDTRSKMAFESFEDLETRIKLTGIKRSISKRILDEIKDEQKYYLFVLKKQKKPETRFG